MLKESYLNKRYLKINPSKIDVKMFALTLLKITKALIALENK